MLTIPASLLGKAEMLVDQDAQSIALLLAQGIEYIKLEKKI